MQSKVGQLIGLVRVAQKMVVLSPDDVGVRVRLKVLFTAGREGAGSRTLAKNFVKKVSQSAAGG